MKKNNKSSKKELINDKPLIILVVLLGVISIILLVTWLNTRNHLDTDSKLVTELHNYFSSDDLTNCDGLFTYADAKIEYNNISSENRLCIAYQKSEIKEAETVSLEAKKKKNTCKVDGMVFKKDEETNKCNVSKIARSEIDNTYKKLFGKDIEDNESFRIDNLNICYLKDDYYYCGLSETFTYTLGSESIIYRVVDKAIEKGSSIEVYDYFIKINERTCYNNYTTPTINQTCTDEYKNIKEVNYKFMRKYGTAYKHTFKQADDETYYWVSSEPIK